MTEKMRVTIYDMSGEHLPTARSLLLDFGDASNVTVLDNDSPRNVTGFISGDDKNPIAEKFNALKEAVSSMNMRVLERGYSSIGQKINLHNEAQTFVLVPAKPAI